MKWVEYPEYENAGVEWLDKIPRHWEVWKITHDFRKVGSGTTPKSDDLNYYDGDVAWVTTTELRETLIADTNTKLTRKALKDYSALRLYPEGTLLFAMYGATIGRIGILSIPATVNQACCAFSEPRRFDIKFFYYWLFYRRPILISLSAGGGQPNLSQEALRSLRVPLPPLDEQRAIATFLDRETERIDTLIAKKDQQIQLLQEKRAALISQAVTKGLNPDAKMKDSGIEWLGEIPEHWEVMKFGYVAFFQEGPGLRNWQFMDTGVRVICVTNITEMGIDFSEYQKYISEEEYESDYRRFTVQKGDLLLSSSGNSWGKVAEFLSNENAILNTSTIRLHELDRPILRSSFIKWVLQSKSIREQLGLMMTGACQPNFGPSHLAMTIVPVQPRDEQQVISSFLDEETGHIDKLVARVQESIETLHEYRTALISAAVTGKIDVRGQ